MHDVDKMRASEIMLKLQRATPEDFPIEVICGSGTMYVKSQDDVEKISLGMYMAIDMTLKETENEGER